jgi:hypothetical protein
LAGAYRYDCPEIEHKGALLKSRDSLAANKASHSRAKIELPEPALRFFTSVCVSWLTQKSAIQGKKVKMLTHYLTHTTIKLNIIY